MGIGQISYFVEVIPFIAVFYCSNDFLINICRFFFFKQVLSVLTLLGLDRHIQAIFVRVQWICQSTASDDFLSFVLIHPNCGLPYNEQLVLLYKTN